MAEDLAYHFEQVADLIQRAKVVPLLGSGVNRCGREGEWHPQHDLPDGRELAAYLVDGLHYPVPDATDLLRVSQYYSVMLGSAELYDTLHGVFAGDYGPTSVHTLLAGVPAALRARDVLTDYQLIVTTNYDDALEKAFEAVQEPYDLLVYTADGEGLGRFLHQPPDGAEARLIESANDYQDVSLRYRTVIMKMHGAVNRADGEHDSYVIAEDHYVDYLTRADISSLVPATLAAKLRESHFLFLGYSLRDWNLRVMLHRMWGEQVRDYGHWAVQLNPEKLDQRLWSLRKVEILDVDLDSYASGLREKLLEPTPT